MKVPDAIKKMKIYLKPVGITAAIILVTGIILYVLAIPFDIYVITALYNYVVTRILNLTGLNQFLVKGIVIIALIPLLWVIPHLFRGAHKKTTRSFVLLYAGIFFLSLYSLSKDLNFSHSGNQNLKWYAMTPEGVKFFDSPGRDPIYGITLKQVTPDAVRNLRLMQSGGFKPIDPSRVQFFNPITGDSQIWYYQYPDNGDYEFYDKPGYHPITGDPLVPATKKIYFDWRERARAFAASRGNKVDDRPDPETAKPNLVVNGGFTSRFAGWERQIGDVTNGSATSEIIEFSHGRSGKALHIKHDGVGFIQYAQLVNVPDGADQVFSVSFQASSHEGPFMGFSGTGVVQIALQYVDENNVALGKTVLLNYVKNPFADTELIGVPRVKSDTYKSRSIEFKSALFHKDYSIDIRKDIEENLMGVNFEAVKKIAIIVWCGANDPRAGSELWITDISLFPKS